MNKHSIDIINKIQPVIHFNKKSYNQEVFGRWVELRYTKSRVKRDQPTVFIETSIIFVVGTAKLCPPNTYLDDKENRMFIEISPHEGVWTKKYSEYPDGTEQSYRLNLNFVREVIFEKRELFEKDGKLFEKIDYSRNLQETSYIKFLKVSKENTTSECEENETKKAQGLITQGRINKEPEPMAITVNIISFNISGDEGVNEWLSLCFSKEGEEEFQRIRRTLDKNTFK